MYTEDGRFHRASARDELLASGKQRQRSARAERGLEREKRRENRQHTERVVDGSRRAAENRKIDAAAKERKEEAKLRGKEIGRARALRLQEERELQEEQRERERIEQQERQRDIEDERWSIKPWWEREQDFARTANDISGHEHQEGLESFTLREKRGESSQEDRRHQGRRNPESQHVLAALERSPDIATVATTSHKTEKRKREHRSRQNMTANRTERDEEQEVKLFQVGNNHKRELIRNNDHPPKQRNDAPRTARSQYMDETLLQRRGADTLPHAYDVRYQRHAGKRTTHDECRSKDVRAPRHKTEESSRTRKAQEVRPTSRGNWWRPSSSYNTLANERVSSAFYRRSHDATSPCQPLSSLTQRDTLFAAGGLGRRATERLERRRPPPDSLSGPKSMLSGSGPTISGERPFRSGHIAPSKSRCGEWGGANDVNHVNMGGERLPTGRGVGPTVRPFAMPLVQGTGTLSASIAGGIGSGTLAVGMGQERTLRGSAGRSGVGTLAIS